LKKLIKTKLFLKKRFKKTPHSNKKVDINSKKQKKLNTVPVKSIQENSHI